MYGIEPCLVNADNFSHEEKWTPPVHLCAYNNPMPTKRPVTRIDENHILLETRVTPEEAKRYLKREFLVELNGRPFKGTIVGFRRKDKDAWFEVALSEPSAREIVSFLETHERYLG